MSIEQKSSEHKDWVSPFGDHYHEHDIKDTTHDIHVTREGRTAEEAEERAWESYAKVRTES